MREETRRLIETLAASRVARLENDLSDADALLSESEQRNRELTRQVEQLRAIVKALLNDRPCGSECEYFHHSKKDQHNYCELCKPILRWEKAVGDALSALTAPPSSSDPGRADTGM